ncbi:Protein of unknown function [Bacillus mycoides]|nr:Protein of unknown function [Bacillus mycoides]
MSKRLMVRDDGD